MDTLKAIDIFERTIEWFEANPDGWLSQSFAHDDYGAPVPYDSDEAVCYCAVGRLFVEAGGVVEAQEAIKVLGGDHIEIMRINDLRGREAMLDYLKARTL